MDRIYDWRRVGNSYRDLLFFVGLGKIALDKPVGCAKLEESGGSERLPGINEDPGVPLESSRAMAPGWPIHPKFRCIDSR